VLGRRHPVELCDRDAFERIAGAIVPTCALRPGGLDGIYLDLHGAAVAEHADDSEGELLARLRAIVGPELPIVASLDLHANVTHRMLREADALVSYRTYPHVDMADTGELAAELLARRLRAGRREPHACAAPAVPDPAERAEHLDAAGPGPVRRAGARWTSELGGTVLSFCMGFPAADFRRVRADGLGPWRTRPRRWSAALRPRRTPAVAADILPTRATPSPARMALAEAPPSRW
jgi:microcystin degradation protein MlrC